MSGVSGVWTGAALACFVLGLLRPLLEVILADSNPNPNLEVTFSALPRSLTRHIDESYGGVALNR